MRRPLLSAFAALLVAAPAASAQVPQQPTPPPPPQQPPPPAPANIVVDSVGGLRQGGHTYDVVRTKVRVSGRMNSAAAGDTVTVELWRDGRRRSHHNAKVARNGSFFTFLKPRVAGGYRVRAVHHRTARANRGHSKRVGFTVVRGSAGSGDGGPKVRLLQLQLARMGYAVPRSGHFDAGTGRAVLAYRKVNRMKRVYHANWTVMSRAFRGAGAFKLRHPSAGKHVEADLTRQVVVLAQNGKPFRVYTTSSGKPSTPTVTGSFRFYSKTAGYNAKGMYYSNYFIRGYAIHGYHEVPTYNASHGCLRVPLANAVSIYNWISLGDRIFVYR